MNIPVQDVLLPIASILATAASGGAFLLGLRVLSKNVQGTRRDCAVDVCSKDGTPLKRIDLRCSRKDQVWCEFYDHADEPMSFKRVIFSEDNTASVKLIEGVKRAELIITRNPASLTHKRHIPILNAVRSGIDF